MAVIILLLLMGSFIMLPYFYTVKPVPPLVDKALLEMAAKMNLASRDAKTENKETFLGAEASTVPANPVLSSFDPNTLSEEGWISMGVRPKTAHTIINYRNKGGRFRVREDISKIWGLRKEDVDRLLPFVQIPDAERSFSFSPHKPVILRQLVTSNRIINIQTATAEEWKTLPGIGEVLASRIVKYRERLGGFTDVGQVKKTYGISDSVFALISPWLKADPANVPKLNLNTLSAYDLCLRANISEAVARAIVAYRKQYGPYQSVDDLKKIVFIKDSLFQKILPYVRVE